MDMVPSPATVPPLASLLAQPPDSRGARGRCHPSTALPLLVVLALLCGAASLLPAVFLATLAGPAVAGVLLTGLVYGRHGFRDLLDRLLRWRLAGTRSRS